MDPTPTPEPTGRVRRTPSGGHELVLARSFDSPIEDVWASLTESDRTAKWIGPWTGTAGAGNTVTLRLGFEESSPESEVLIEECEAPHHLAVTALDASGEWRLDLRLNEESGVTMLIFTQPLPDPTIAESVGPGWEWYLDLLLASREGLPQPAFESYYPAQSAYYAAQAAE